MVDEKSADTDEEKQDELDSSTDEDEDVDDGQVMKLNKNQNKEFFDTFREVCKQRITEIERSASKEWTHSSELEQIVEEPDRRTTTRIKQNSSIKEHNSEKISHFDSDGSNAPNGRMLPPNHTKSMLPPNFTESFDQLMKPWNAKAMDMENGAIARKSLATGKPNVERMVQDVYVKDGDKYRRFSMLTKKKVTVEEYVQLIDYHESSPEAAKKTPSKREQTPSKREQTPTKRKATTGKQMHFDENTTPKITKRIVEVRTPLRYTQQSGATRIPKSVIKGALKGQHDVPNAVLHDVTLNDRNETIRVCLDETPVTPLKMICAAGYDPLEMARKSAQKPRLVRGKQISLWFVGLNSKVFFRIRLRCVCVCVWTYPLVSSYDLFMLFSYFVSIFEQILIESVLIYILCWRWIQCR